MSETYQGKRSQLETYFDRTATEAWARLTSDAPVSRIRATVRAGRERMQAVLLDMLPRDLSGARVLDAGCGFGPLSIAMAERGAEVVAVDLARTAVDTAAARTPEALRGRIDYRAGDMLDPELGRFDHVVAMDSLIHYRARDVAHALGRLTPRVSGRIVFTTAPRTMPLTLMLAAGAIFPRSDRSPDIQPVSARGLTRAMRGDPALAGWNLTAGEAVKGGFYFSRAMEVRKG